ncbi:C-type lectin domain family 12 member B-like [Hemitrygon akajei]|uniref:C-type lectin domain family 12 member B-like n=1 Tax=Hemitrygon akajei TaxID=2704970 RepID=UPI003BF97C30
MDRSESHINVKSGKTDSRSPSRVEPDASYAEVIFKTLSSTRVRTDRDGLNSIYTELKFRKEEPRIDEDEDSPISSGPGRLSTTAQTGAQKQEPKENIGNRSCRKICLLCLVASIIIAIVAGLWIYVSQIRLCQHQGMNRTQTKYGQQLHNLNSTVESKMSDNSRLNFIDCACLQNISLLKSSLDEICQFLTSSRERICSKAWEKYGDRCYFFSTFKTSYDGARQQCSDFDSRLLEISSKDEASFVLDALSNRNGARWVGKCENGKVASELLYEVYSGSSACSNCNSYIMGSSCSRDRRFICEKSAALFPDIPQKIQDLCLQPVEPN